MSGAQGIWQFTGEAETDWWVSVFQEMEVTAGASFRARGSVRVPSGQPWVEGAEAYLRVMFLTDAGDGEMVLDSSRSEPFFSGSSDWVDLEVETRPAPKGASRVRFAIYLEKPDGTSGQATLNIDDCSLVRVVQATARASSHVLGIGEATETASFELTNLGDRELAWNAVIDPSAPWLSAPVSEGTIAPLSTQLLTVRGRRAGLDVSSSHRGQLTIDTDANDLEVAVYLEMPSPPPPADPAEVVLFGRQLRVRDRLPGGALSDPYHYVIRGCVWSPVSTGTDPSLRRPEFTKWAVADAHLLAEMNVNTVRLFLDPGLGPEGLAVLDVLYRTGIKAIINVDDQGTADTGRLAKVVRAFRSHPALLAWSIGNEWNVNFYGQNLDNLMEAAVATEAMAQQVKALDPLHPVLSILGDIDINHLNPLTMAEEDDPGEVSTERIVNEICVSVDAWGLNIYRSDSFGNLFEQWESITDRPMLLSEYGTDAYRSALNDVRLIDGQEDEQLQATTNRVLWAEIAANLSALELNGSCLGGTCFEWCDEWWKVKEIHGGNDDVRENLGFFGGHPDGFANEEWFGLVTANRIRRLAYSNYQADFAATVAPADLDADGLPDAWEYAVIDAAPEGSPTTIEELLPDGDLDFDGRTNLDEFMASTDALDPGSRLAIRDIVWGSDGVRIRWTAGAGTQQILERASNPNANVWATIHQVAAPAPSQGEFIDDQIGGGEQYYYRLRTIK
ncbi:MAG: glycoside hydrolase family 2 TIM barrel-domain containing protein [Verrucomicrobiales bacterium]